MKTIEKLFQQATLGSLGVACVLSGVLMASDMSAEAASTVAGSPADLLKKGVPGYLVKSDMPPEIVSMEKSGNLTSATEALQSRKLSSADQAEQKQLDQEIFRLNCLKREFSTEADDMLKKIQARIPDATSEDLERWTSENALSWIPVDGKIGYFRREPGILVRFNTEAKTRAEARDASDPAANAKEGFSFTGHMRAALDAAKSEGTSVVLPVRFKVRHTATLKPGKVKAGEMVRCWLPYPREDSAQQSSVTLLSMRPDGKIGQEQDSPQRTVYLEQPAGADGSATFVLDYEYTGAAYVPDLAKARPDFTEQERAELSQYLRPREPHLQFSEDVTSLSRSLVGTETTIVGKAFNIWSWLDKTIKWCPEMEYAVMPDIVAKVMAERKGDCGTQALTFVALARAAGVPARWQSGWVTKPGAWNMHDWAEFYAPGIGWVPVDPSVGRQESSDAEVRDFLFGHIDAYRMIANSDYGREFSPAKNSYRSDPVDNQRGEMEWSGGNLYYDDWSYDVKVDQN